MRFATAVGRLTAIAQDCDRVGSLLPGDEEGDGSLLAVYAYGPVVDQAGRDMEVVRLVLVLDLPAEELPWGVEPPECTALAALLRLDKAPVLWRWRPGQWPVWNHEIRRPMPIWTREGVQGAALDALSSGRAEPFRLPEPAESEQLAQAEVELAVSLAHLRAVRERYWEDREWRRAHRGGGRYPEEYLWQAVDGYLDMVDSVRALSSP